MARGLVYLVAVVDWATRRVLAWRLSNSLGADLCVDVLRDAIRRQGAREILNTDQGSQFTDADFITLLPEHGIAISMDGKAAGATTYRRTLDDVYFSSLPQRAAA